MQREEVFVNTSLKSLFSKSGIALVALIHTSMIGLFFKVSALLFFYAMFTLVFYSLFLNPTPRKRLAFASTLFVIIAIHITPDPASHGVIGMNDLIDPVRLALKMIRHNSIVLLPAAATASLLVRFRIVIRRFIFARLANKYFECTHVLVHRWFDGFCSYYETQISQSVLVFIVMLAGLALTGIEPFWQLSWFFWVCSFVPFWGLLLGMLPACFYALFFSGNPAIVLGIVIIWTFSWLLRFLWFDNSLRSFYVGKTHFLAHFVLLASLLIFGLPEMTWITVSFYLSLMLSNSSIDVLRQFQPYLSSTH